MADFGASLGVVERAEILPFHQMGRYKWERLGIEYELERDGAADKRGRRSSGQHLPRRRASRRLSSGATARHF